MARINSKNMLTSYIRSQLGEPLIRVEVTDDQIAEIIDDTVQKFTEYAYGTLEGTVIVQISGMGDYAVPENITNIIKLSKGNASNISNFSANFGSGYVPNLWSEQYFSGSLTGDIIPGIMAISTTKSILDKYFSDELSYNFNHLAKKIQILENYTGGVVLHYQYEYLAEDEDLVYNHEWVKNYSKNMVKSLWGNNVGKFDQALVGGARINYDRLLSEAGTEIDRLNEELLNKWSDPCPILVG